MRRPRRFVLTLVTLLLLRASQVHAAPVTALWDPNPEPDLAGYRLSYGTAPGVYTTTIDVGNVTTWTGDLPPGRYYFTLVAYDTTGAVSPVSAEVGATLAGVPVPPPWVAQDVGSPTLAGSTSLTAGVWTVSGAGADIWDASDQFQFVSQPLTGDGTITARVDSLGNTAPFAKAGVMIREDLTANAPNALAYVSPGRGVLLSQRVTRGGGTASVNVPGLVAPYWVRLARVGSVFSAFRSADGIAWLLLGTTTVPMASTAQVGLAVVSLTPATATTGVFSNVSVVRTVVAPVPAPASTFRVVR